MKKKKIRAKLQLRNRHTARTNRRGPLCLLRRSSHLKHYPILGVVLGVLLLSSCITALAPPDRLMFANPPVENSWLQPQRELFACETIDAARYMGDFGFVHPLCTQLLDIGEQDYRVIQRETVQLKEGPMWIIHAQHKQQTYYVPLPWHDWL